MGIGEGRVGGEGLPASTAYSEQGCQIFENASRTSRGGARKVTHNE